MKIFCEGRRCGQRATSTSAAIQSTPGGATRAGDATTISGLKKKAKKDSMLSRDTFKILKHNLYFWNSLKKMP